MNKRSYISVTYDQNDKPITEYPKVLAQYLIDRFKLKSGAKLLDTGCGRADMLNAFSRLGLVGYGCDIEACPGDYTACEVKEFDFSKDTFPYPDNFFNVVFSKSVLEHLYDPRNYLREIYRILAPGGVVIIFTPDWKSQYKTFYDESTHVHAYTVLSVKDCLVLNGFKYAHTELFNHHKLIWRSRLWRLVAKFLSMLYTSETARKLEKITKIKYLRWAAELNVLGYGFKHDENKAAASHQGGV